MAGPALPLTITAGSTTGHATHHAAIHDVVNMFDKDLVPNSGDVLTWNSGTTLYEPEAPTGGVGGGTAVFAQVVNVNDFTGANVSAKFRDACTNYVSLGKPVVYVPAGTTLDSGANNPFVLPTGFHMMCTPGIADEPGSQSTINIRHTSSTTTLGVFQWASGSRDQKFSGISFKGTSTTRAFVDQPLDGSGSTQPTYVMFNNVIFDQFESVMQTSGTGVKWAGICFMNNMAAGREPVYFAGSDHTMWSNGCLWELGAVGSYATRSALSAMFRTGSLSNCSIGAIYWTGSPTTPVRVDGGNGGLDFSQAVLEGRPSPGTTVDGSGNPTGGLHCNGPLARVTGGRTTFRNREHGYAMRDPRSATHGYQPGGFYHISAGTVVIDGGSFNPYSAATYTVAYTDPSGASVAASTIPPIAWVASGATLMIKNVIRGPNASAVPVVRASTGATIVNDASVSVSTF